MGKHVEILQDGLEMESLAVAAYVSLLDPHSRHSYFVQPHSCFFNVKLTTTTSTTTTDGDAHAGGEHQT